MNRPLLACLSLLMMGAPVIFANELETYFERETAALEARCLADIQSKEDWMERKDLYRRQLQEMLGLAPWPERTALEAVVTGTIDHEAFTVEKLHYQSLPGLYVTGNLYVPKGLEAPAPAILYVCGHGRVVEDGVSLGNKAHYQHHGAWFARHGYVCLIIDTIQLGEIEGLHHGTYREGMWWWNNRGYTPAGVEAWNGIRALDYLQARPEVDGERLGITGRSGGGIYSWWVGALDERIKVAVPVAGITSLRNHVVDGVVEGHCDCMYHINTYRWDFPHIAALMAPRPLLISNTDKDSIFPLDGVYAVYRKVERIYRLLGAEDHLGLQITEGPHQDTQALRVHAFHWFNRFLKGETPLIRVAAEPLLEPRALRVFASLPQDERTSVIHETFVPGALPPRPPLDQAGWERLRESWMAVLRAKVFAGWPVEGETDSLPALVELENLEGADLGVRLVDEVKWVRESGGVGKAHHLRRRFMLLGQTLDGMRVWDLRRQLEQRSPENGPVVLRAEGLAAGVALYAALFVGEAGADVVSELRLRDLPVSHREGPTFLNVSKYLEMPQTLAMVAERRPVVVEGVSKGDEAAWAFAVETLKTLGLGDRLRFER